MRLIFIPGFGETPRIFDHLAPYLPGEKVFIDNQEGLGVLPNPTMTLIRYAQQLVDQHHITASDVVLGHSMGGWIAYAIKQVVGGRVVQIASWTDAKKVVSPISNPQVIFWAVRKGLYFNRFTKGLLLRIGYRHQPSSPIFSAVFQHLIDSPNEYIINQLRLILTPFEPLADVRPDLRIHAKNDSIVRFPDQPAVMVSGDHFSLYTYPQEVASTIQGFLASIPNDEAVSSFGE